VHTHVHKYIHTCTHRHTHTHLYDSSVLLSTKYKSTCKRFCHRRSEARRQPAGRPALRIPKRGRPARASRQLGLRGSPSGTQRQCRTASHPAPPALSVHVPFKRQNASVSPRRALRQCELSSRARPGLGEVHLSPPRGQRAPCHRHEGSERRASARAHALTGVEVWRMVWGLPLQPQQSKSRDIARAELNGASGVRPGPCALLRDRTARRTGTARTVGSLAQQPLARARPDFKFLEVMRSYRRLV
jgi:hypothetical protein